MLLESLGFNQHLYKNSVKMCMGLTILITNTQLHFVLSIFVYINKQNPFLITAILFIFCWKVWFFFPILVTGKYTNIYKRIPSTNHPNPYLLLWWEKKKVLHNASPYDRFIPYPSIQPSEIFDEQNLNYRNVKPSERLLFCNYCTKQN